MGRPGVEVREHEAVDVIKEGSFVGRLEGRRFKGDLRFGGRKESTDEQQEDATKGDSHLCQARERAMERRRGRSVLPTSILWEREREREEGGKTKKSIETCESKFLPRGMRRRKRFREARQDGKRDLARIGSRSEEL